MNWIRVEDKLPDGKVLCAVHITYENGSSGCKQNIWHGMSKSRRFSVNFIPDEYITHWILQDDFNEAIKPIGSNSEL